MKRLRVPCDFELQYRYFRKIHLNDAQIFQGRGETAALIGLGWKYKHICWAGIILIGEFGIEIRLDGGLDEVDDGKE